MALAFSVVIGGCKFELVSCNDVKNVCQPCGVKLSKECPVNILIIVRVLKVLIVFNN